MIGAGRGTGHVSEPLGECRAHCSNRLNYEVTALEALVAGERLLSDQKLH